MELAAPDFRNSALEREPRELVAERDRLALGAQHPRRNARIQAFELAGDGLEQPQLGARGHDRGHLEDSPRTE